ncbi:MAG: A/G-specific adenine glycosylase [Planctomycetota bacterium]
MNPTPADPRRIRAPLRRWYQRRKRPLPWRTRGDPYSIWISEVMLQQTRVETVIPYYQRFVKRFPDPRKLAAASEEEVLSHWAGLGYYSRGRNLLRAAQWMVRENRGAFPTDAEAIRALPGVGEYTAAAVQSIAFGTPLSVIDGNVERVLCRFLGIEENPRRGRTRLRIREAAERALHRRDPGTHNQAMMELGATVCLPRKPRCQECPLAVSCRARRNGYPEQFPRPRAKRAPEPQSWIAVVPTVQGAVLLMRTPGDAELLAGHWGVPLERWRGSRPPSRERALSLARARCHDSYGVSPRGGRLLGAVRHSITHRRLWVYPVRFSLRRPPRGDFHSCGPGEEAAVPSLFRKIIAGSRR